MNAIDKWKGSNLNSPDYLQHFNYIHKDTTLADFSDWLRTWMNSEEFNHIKDKFIVLHIKLKHEKDSETREYLFAQIRQLEGL